MSNRLLSHGPGKFTNMIKMAKIMPLYKKEDEQKLLPSTNVLYNF